MCYAIRQGLVRSEVKSETSNQIASSISQILSAQEEKSEKENENRNNNSSIGVTTKTKEKRRIIELDERTIIGDYIDK